MHNVRVSYSSVTRFRTCQQSYYYSNVLGIRRVDKAPQLELGTIVHAYLQRYYTELKNGTSASAAHQAGMTLIQTDFTSQLAQYRDLAFAAGNEDLAKRFDSMMRLAQMICTRYFSVRGLRDASEYTFLMVEEPVIATISPTITSLSILDLVTESQSGLQLWEHKTAESIPGQDRRLRDLQTLLFAKVGAMVLGREFDGVVWNYARTKEPAVPDLLKSGQLSRRKDLDTTWGVYRSTIVRHGLDEGDYQDVYMRLHNAEQDRFFPRYELPILQQDEILIADYIRTAESIQEERFQWESGRRTPIRNVGFQCDFCEYALLCKTVILGGDEDDVIKLRFTSKEEVSTVGRN